MIPHFDCFNESSASVSDDVGPCNTLPCLSDIVSCKFRKIHQVVDSGEDIVDRMGWIVCHFPYLIFSFIKHLCCDTSICRAEVINDVVNRTCDGCGGGVIAQCIQIFWVWTFRSRLRAFRNQLNYYHLYRSSTVIRSCFYSC